MDARPPDGTSRNSSDDDEHGSPDAFIDQQTAIVDASARTSHLTPPRRKIVFGLPTPPTPDPRPRLYFDLASPTPPSRNNRNDTKLLTSAGEPSEPSSEECTGSFTSTTSSPSAGIPTPDNTPIRRLTCWKGETSTQSAVESIETSSASAEIVQNKLSGISEPEDDTSSTTSVDDREASLPTSSAKAKGPGRRQSNTTTQSKATTQCGTPCKRMVKPPTQGCRDHPVTDNTSITPATPTVPTVVQTAPTGTPQYSAIGPATEVDTLCRGTTSRHVRCKLPAVPPSQYCHFHIPATDGIPIVQTAPTTPTSPYTRCRGEQPCGARCRRRVKSPAQYCRDHVPATHDTPVVPTAPTEPTAPNPQYTDIADPDSELYTQCRGKKPRGARCKRRVKPPAQYCRDHVPATHDTPVVPTVPTEPTAPNPQYTDIADPDSELYTRCRGKKARGARCKRRVKPPAQYCREHVPVTHAPIIPTTPTSPAGTPQHTLAVPTAGPDTQCHGTTRHGIRCKRTVKYPAQHCRQHVSATHNIPVIPTTLTAPAPQYIATVPIYISINLAPVQHCPQHISVTHSIPITSITPTKPTTPINPKDPGFRVQRPGQEEVFVCFGEHIPQYLQLNTQRKLRNFICEMFSKNVKTPGYVYALDVTDPEQGEIAWKIGFSKDVEKRAKEWKGHSHITDHVHWQWPGTTVKHEDNKTSIQDIARTSQRGDVCLAAEQLERLVHIELRDLATHEAYLHADWPDVKYSDVPRKSKAYYTPCNKCSKQHEEIFSFRRIKEGRHLGKEWGDIVEPVIMRWVWFLKKYFLGEV